MAEECAGLAPDQVSCRRRDTGAPRPFHVSQPALTGTRGRSPGWRVITASSTFPCHWPIWPVSQW